VNYSARRNDVYLLKRPVARPSNDVRRSCANFTYPAGSWPKLCRVIAKVEWHAGEHNPRVGSIVTNMARRAENFVGFYKKHGMCKQWIKWSRLFCRSFTADAVSLWLHALAYNLGNFFRALETPKPIKDWSMAALREKLTQDWREVRRPCLGRRFPDGRRPYSEKPFRRYSADDHGTSPARHIILQGVRVSQNNGRGASL
jgi:Transposase DDE domain group 1